MNVIIYLVGLSILLVAYADSLSVLWLVAFSAAVGLLWSVRLQSRHEAIAGAGVSSTGNIRALFGTVFWGVASLTALFPKTALISIPLALLIRTRA